MEKSPMESFLDMYSLLDATSIESIREVYRDDVRFIDPAHEINGIRELSDYFTSLYSHVETIRFHFEKVMAQDTCGYVQWEMTFSHRRFAGGRAISVPGVTYVEFDKEGRVFYHRDFFDLGAMLYEHVPVLGRIVQGIRRRLGK